MDFLAKLMQQQIDEQNRWKQSKAKNKYQDMKQKYVPEEREIPMDFDGDKSPQVNTGTYLDNVRESDTAQELLDQLVTEDATLYNASMFLWDEIYKFDTYKDNYKVYQILPLQGSKGEYLIVGCEIVINEDKPSLKLSWFKDTDSNSSQREEYVILLEAMTDITRFISAKDVVPNDKPLKLFRDFRDYIRLIIFSFMVYYPEAEKNKNMESIQIKQSTKGIIDHEIHIKFCNKECSLVLKYIEDTTFRITFYIASSTENNFSRGISIDIKCDLPSYNRIFKEINNDEVLKKHPDLDKSEFVKSHELVDASVIKKCAKKVLKSLYLSYIIGYQGTWKLC